jgi:hypothetical protein
VKTTVTVLVLALLSGPLLACSFCGDSFARRQPLRERFAESKLVLAGQLKNAVANPDGTGSTEFHIATVLKGEIGKHRVLTIPRYLPVVADTPPDFVFFCTIADGKIEPVHGVSGGKALVDYLKAIDVANSVPARLAQAFAHLDADDSTVSTEAFLEFARASDAELAGAKGVLDRKKLRGWIADPKTPVDRLGVYGLLLGLCGDAADAKFLLTLLKSDRPDDRIASNLGGLLGGAILLAPDDGWKFAAQLLADPKRNFSVKLNAISTLRFFQATRPKESRERILACLAVVIANGDLADLAIDDLRRWKWWDLTATIFEQYPKPSHAAPATRRGIVRYALQCPDESAKAFVADVRAKDPALVKKVEDNLKLFEKK